MNSEPNHKELPKDVKYSTYNAQTNDIVFAEYEIASAIHNGTSFDELIEHYKSMVEEKKTRTKEN